MIQDLHRHDFVFILMLAKGKGQHVIDFVPYTIVDHSIFILRPGQVHQLTLKAGSAGFLMELDRGFYHRHGQTMNEVFRQVSNTNFCHVPGKAFPKLHSILTDIFQEYTEQKEGYQDVIKATLDIFFIEFFRQRRSNTARKTSSFEQGRVDEFLELLETNVARHKQVSFYAGLLNISVYQLNALTKAAAGKTPSEMINDYIILEAKRHLLATSDQVNQIAYQLGYDDPSYFIRFFKKHTGHSPEVFRTNFR
jgi:AraC-like DNA-binding protein